MRSGMKYLLAVPVVILLAAAFYIFYVYDPNPSKNTNNEVSITRDETKQSGLAEIGTTTVTDAAELTKAPVTLPAEEKSTDAASSNEENQAEVAVSDEENSDESASSGEAEPAENFLSTADDNTTEETTLSAADDSKKESTNPSVVDKSTEESTTPVAVDEPAEETTTPVAVVDEPAEETTTPVAVDESVEETTTPVAVDESMEESTLSTAAEEPIEDSSTEDAAAKTVTYVETGSADSPQTVSFAEDYSRETAAKFEQKQPQSIVADDQQQLSDGYIVHRAVITSSLSQATSDAGLSANQSARIGRIFKPYLDSSRELRKGDELTIFLDPGAAKTGNDADQIHRLEFQGVRKNLVVIRKEGSLNDYEVRDADGKMLRGGVSTTSIVVAPPQREVDVEPAPAVEETRREVPVEPAPAVEEPRREVPVEPAPVVEKPRREVVPVETVPHSAADYNAATGDMKRLEGVVSITLFSAARDAGLNAGQLKKLEEIMNPYINFNKDVRKGDRIVITLDGSDIYSSEFNGVVKKLTVVRSDDGTYREVKPGDIDVIPGESGDDNSGARKLPFWKRWWNKIGSSTDEEGSN